MYLGTFPTDSAFMYIGFWLFAQTYKLILPFYKVVVIYALFNLVWHVIKTGDWLHSVGGYLFYVILLVCLLSHTTTISPASFKPRATAGEQTRSTQGIKISKISASAGPVRIPTVFLFAVRMIDTFSNNLADIISKGDYVENSFEYIHAQAAIANSEITGEAKEDYLDFCEQCFKKALVDVKLGKIKDKNGKPYYPDSDNKDFPGADPYLISYAKPNHKMLWRGENKEINCRIAYDRLHDILMADLGKNFGRVKLAKARLISAWGKIKMGKWLSVIKNRMRIVKGRGDEMLRAVLLMQEKKLIPEVKQRMYRDILPGDSSGKAPLLHEIAKGKLVGFLGGSIGVGVLLAFVSFFIRLAPLAQGACLCLCIGTFPILIALSLLPHSIRVLRTAFLFLFQTSMWSVAWATVNLLSQIMCKILPGDFTTQRVDIPLFTLLMVVSAPVISGIFITGVTNKLSTLNIPVSSPTGAISAAKGAVK